MKDLPSEEELFAGAMKDGSRPPLHSRELYEKFTKDAFGKPLPPELRDKTPSEESADELRQIIELQRLEMWDEIIEAGRFLKDAGLAVLNGVDEEEVEEVVEVETTENTSHVDSPAPSDEPNDDSSARPTDKSPREETENPPAQSESTYGKMLRLPSPSPPRARPVRGGFAFMPESQVKKTPTEEERARSMHARSKAVIEKIKNGDLGRKRKITRADTRGITRKHATSMVYTGARMMTFAVDKRAECALKLVEMTKKQDLKEAFMWDRAHAVVAATLLHLDEEFQEVGFGSWMPFRYPDQWLMFCGIMKRVLAANGLIYAEHADTYRRLLDDAEPVADPIGDIDERIEWWNTPENWSTCWTNRGALNMDVLRQRLMDEVWDPTTQFGGTRAPPN